MIVLRLLALFLFFSFFMGVYCLLKSEEKDNREYWEKHFRNPRSR